MGIKEEIINSFKSGSTLTKLIYINLGLFVIVGLGSAILTLFNVSNVWTTILMLPSKFSLLIIRPWSIITYMFLHLNFIHLLFNILTFYWFGNLFMQYYSQKELVGLYITSGILGGVLYMLAYSIFPYFADKYGDLTGASAAVMGIIVAVAVTAPDRLIRLMFIGDVKLKWIAIVGIIISLLNVASENAGGNISHIGGALGGYLFVLASRKGKDITAWVNRPINFLANLFNRSPKMKVTYNNNRPMTDQEYNYNKKQEAENIDKILDKIKKSGYESLSKEEKRQLFSASGKRQ
ncbi:MAG TPA: rhomboid family intramembrane serine protease [Paludibacteraceae bacterium]|nr:rhomboid family intramembrane serine protease [Paludibacteraceae bacterium]HPH62830.1 rhomboid family intramembrane serine protease [Paludibacteraceae bacterium]